VRLPKTLPELLDKDPTACRDLTVCPKYAIINTYTNTQGAYMLTQCIAKAKLVYNKKLQSYKLVVAFNAHKTIKKIGNTEVVKYAFPTQAKCTNTVEFVD
jgi:hypothetical protein